MTTLELRQLRYFVAVADTAQLTDAARRLQIAQPTLSQALTQLEDQLGVQLLERHTRGVRLTDAGRAFLDKARAAVRAAEQAASTAHALGRAQSRVLEVGFHWLPLTKWAPLFQRLCQDHPGTRLRWQPLAFPRADSSPIDDVDVGLILEPLDRPDLNALVLQCEPRVVVMAATHPLAGRQQLTVADVLDETFPGAHPSVDRRWQAIWTLDEERGGPARRTEDRIVTGEEGADVVASGRAIATTPSGLAAALPHPGLVAVPLVDARPSTLALVWRAEHDNPLVDELVTSARALVELDGHAASP